MLQSHILTFQQQQQSIATSPPYMSSSSNVAIITDRGNSNDGDGVLNAPPTSPAPSISLTLPSPVLTKSTSAKLLVDNQGIIRQTALSSGVVAITSPPGAETSPSVAGQRSVSYSAPNSNVIVKTLSPTLLQHHHPQQSNQSTVTTPTLLNAITSATAVSVKTSTPSATATLLPNNSQNVS